MDAILACIFAMPLHFPVEVRDGEGLRNGYSRQVLNASQDTLGSLLHIGTLAMIGKLEALAVGEDRAHDRVGCFFAARSGRGRENCPGDARAAIAAGSSPSPSAGRQPSESRSACRTRAPKRGRWVRRRLQNYADLRPSVEAQRTKRIGSFQFSFPRKQVSAQRELQLPAMLGVLGACGVPAESCAVSRLSWRHGRSRRRVPQSPSRTRYPSFFNLSCTSISWAKCLEIW